MTNNDFYNFFEQSKIEILNAMESTSPYKTGYLRRNIKLVKNINGYSILFEAPYTIYTEEPWVGRIRQNPNEYWIKECLEQILALWTAKLGGRVVKLK